MKKKATIYLNEEIWREFRLKCLRNGVSASEMIEYLIRENINRPLPEMPIGYDDRRDDDPTPVG